NTTAAAIDISGWTISDAQQDSACVSPGASLVVPAQAYVVLGNNDDILVNGGVTVAWSYGAEWYLANGDDEIVLHDVAGAEVFNLAYGSGDTGPSPAVSGGRSTWLNPLLLNGSAAQDFGNWCSIEGGAPVWVGGPPGTPGDEGTPGTVNPSCP
ncbi:MAG TPA: hypothetical protein DIU15_05255, partial [Deltaproteobacteria bacterium]|nr:hypothetical protein [Deltaproteobacteria bacterium]